MFVLKREEDGCYVARSGCAHSYTNNRALAMEFPTIEQAKAAKCENEEIYLSHRERRVG